MEKQPIERQGNSNHAEPPPDFPVTIESTPPRCYRPLLKAAFEGNWEFAERFFQGDSRSETAIITSKSETVLHIAALYAHDQFAENLVKRLSSEALAQVDCDGRTALHNAVLCGRIRIVEALVDKNSILTQIQDAERRVPFNLSTREASMHKDIAWFLAQKTTFDGPIHPDNSDHAIQCTVDLAFAGHLDIVLYLVEQYPSLILERGGGEKDRSILGALARMPSHFSSGTRLSVLETIIYKCIPVDVNYRPTYNNSRNAQTSTDPVPIPSSIKRIHDVKLRHQAAVKLVNKICDALSMKDTTIVTQFFQDGDLLDQAAAMGIRELVKLSIQNFPEIMPGGTKLMRHAVYYRQERIIRLFLKESSTNGFSLVPAPTQKESEGMMLDVAGYNRHFDDVAVSGAAFEMQRELQWFKAMESWLTPKMRNTRFEPDNETAWQMFVKKHKTLLENGQKWVKETADKCMLVSTLIATVLFAAIFTVPGTKNDGNGFPLKGSTLVFVISDGLGLLCSVMATLLFLAILTSRNEPLDFLDSLPKKIIKGLYSLFLSLAFMMVAFATTLTFVLDKTPKWIAIPIALLTFLPVILFVVLQLPLLFQMVKSTYGPSMFCAKGIWK